jgi:hypothetical protein
MVTALALLLHAASALPIAAAHPRLLVLVRTEGTTAIEERRMRTIAGGVRDIWRPYIDVVFGAAGDLRRTIEDDQLQLVITDRLAAGADGSLGWIAFVNGQPARTITVSRGAAEKLAVRASWAGKRLNDFPRRIREQFVDRAIARSIAHEIGHYLLRSKTHAAEGLMRERFTVDEIMDITPAHYRLNRTDLQQLERRLREYAEAQSVDTRPPA